MSELIASEKLQELIAGAIKAAVAEERASLAEVQMLAYQWMKCHDALLAWVQDNPSRLIDFNASGPRPPHPSPVNLPDAIAAAVAKERARCLKIVRKHWVREPATIEIERGD